MIANPLYIVIIIIMINYYCDIPVTIVVDIRMMTFEGIWRYMLPMTIKNDYF